MYCLWMMDQGKAHVPASPVDCIAQGRLERAARNAKRVAADDARFRVDENAFAEFARELREDKKATRKTQPQERKCAWGYVCGELCVIIDIKYLAASFGIGSCTFHGSSDDCCIRTSFAQEARFASGISKHLSFDMLLHVSRGCFLFGKRWICRTRCAGNHPIVERR